MAIGAISSQRAKHVTPAVSPSITKVGAYWSPGQGMVRPGEQGRQWGLYVSGSVKQGHDLKIASVKRDLAKKTVTITVGSPGSGTGKKTESKEAFAGGGFSMQAQKWTVVVKDQKGHQLLKKQMMLGGPPAP